MSDVLNNVFFKLKQLQYMKDQLRNPFDEVSKKYSWYMESLFQLSSKDNLEKSKFYFENFQIQLEDYQTALRRTIYAKVLNSDFLPNDILEILYTNNNSILSENVCVEQKLDHTCKIVVPIINGVDVLIPLGEKYKCVDIKASEIRFLIDGEEIEISDKELMADSLSFNNVDVFHDRIYHLQEDSFFHIKTNDKMFNLKVNAIEIIYRVVLMR